MNYELSLLVDAIESHLTKDKRKMHTLTFINDYDNCMDIWNNNTIHILPIKTCTKCSKEFENIRVNKI